MKNTLLKILCCSAVLASVTFAQNGTFKDPRDKHVYKTVKVAGKTWFAENLAYKTKNSICYKDDPANCEKNGRLYNLKEAKKACPKGWHIAESDDFRDLLDKAGQKLCMDNCQFGKNEDGGCKYNAVFKLCRWLGAKDGLNKLGFNPSFAGYKKNYADGNNQVVKEGDGLIFWTMQVEDFNAEFVDVEDGRVSILDEYMGNDDCYGSCGTNFYSVRCVKD